MRLTANEVYDKLLNEDKILTAKGQIKFYLGNVDIVVKQKDVVGNIIQEWLAGWLNSKGIDYAINPNTQMPPDIFLNPDNHTEDLLEIKAFYHKGGPGFDIADFNAYRQEIINSPYMLHAKYLIFSYDMTPEGVVVIKNIWLKNVWEICRPMKKWALNLQIKRNVVHKIRPATWYSKRGSFKTFETLEDFLAAVEECVYQNPDTRFGAAQWKPLMIENYAKCYNSQLFIPRWDDIKNKYIVLKKR